ncbi:hypothetical protein CUM54_13410 [Enterococcus faecalis]|uniref:hypothetical protein n=1 Tax=Enterococcus TaxID=1350 RepID=UPI00053C0106|nr:hypothetical protein [Enterococcus faecalis]EGO5014768.1 hypothetical protein [Enterococcus faecalis]EGO7719950.1 hypothetical protein [Enterococcus faecalis]EJX7951009.1 hypothetical protein [Enterococcus faecalis]EKO5957330.1 hypothetical protein [Enterococcus faecalis]KII42432.1 hypothetical protein QR18_05635 [Enterococcus faecalis]
MTNIIEKLCDKGILDIEDITSSQPSELFNDFKQIEKQTQDSMKQIIYISYENVDESKKEKYILERLENLINLESYLMESEEFNNLYIIFKNWEQEREALDIFLDNASSASEKKSINAIFSFCQPIYSEIPNKMTLKVDDEGINYLEYEGIECMEAKIFNVSMYELQKLYNILGTSLFQNNVRIGLANRKTGKELKEEFKSYLLTGLYGEHKDDSEEAQNYFGMSESDLLKFNPDIFWYKHNGINIYMNENGSFEFSSDAILLNPQNANVINGAQTLTSFFLAKEEVLKDLSGIVELDKQGLTQAIDEILKNIVVKTIFIKGSSDLTPTITWGLNNQIPITEQDFIGVSGEVEKLNNLLGKYQLKILKTGEIEKIYTGLTPLSFMKLYLIAQEQPGKSKNYNKKNLKIDLSEAVENIRLNNMMLDKIDLTVETEKWWNNYIKGIEEKTYFHKYARNYFQSFVIHMKYFDNRDNLLDSDLEIYFEELENLLKEHNPDINKFKNDELFKEIVQEAEEKHSVTNDNTSQVKVSLEDLVLYVNNNRKTNYSISATIKKFNEERNITLKYFRTIPILNRRVKESMPLPNSSFEEFYKWDGYLKDDKQTSRYKQFEESLFYRFIQEVYPIYVIIFNEDKEVIDIKFISSFSITKGKDWEENAKKTYNMVKDAFEQGDIEKFPKISTGIGFHIRPKAINSSDTFQFTDGKDITKRTFWVNSSYIAEILNQCLEGLGLLI